MTWTALGESVTGTSHRARNTPCQDAFRHATFGNQAEWLVIAVADGAGSASHSDVGAALACEELVRRAGALQREALFSREGVIALFNDVRTMLTEEAQRLDVRPRELACTALLAIVGPETTAFAQLGDGAFVVNQDEGHRVVFWPDPAEYANATDFLTDERFADVVRFETSTAPVHEIAVLTDGLQRLALDFAGRSAHPGFFQPLFRELRAAADPQALTEPFREFLDSQRVNDRTDDDKTLVLGIRSA